jgi:hypothetical protein
MLSDGEYIVEYLDVEASVFQVRSYTNLYKCLQISASDAEWLSANFVVARLNHWIDELPANLVVSNSNGHEKLECTWSRID